jgi:uncharacterized protein
MSASTRPGVYTPASSTTPMVIAEVATAVPAFIGYTEKAEARGRSLQLRPWRIDSMAAFHAAFGAGPVGREVRFALDAAPPPPADAAAAKAAAERLAATPLAGRDAVELRLGAARYVLTQTHGLYLLHAALALFFLNGGGACFVVSVGGYAQAGAPGTPGPRRGVAVRRADFEAGLKALEQQPQPTIVVVPEAVLLPRAECEAVQRSVVSHCGQVMKGRVAILDVWEGYKRREDGPRDCVADFRDGLQGAAPSHAAAYYPWVHTTGVAVQELSLRHIAPESRATLVQALKDDLALRRVPEPSRAAQAREIDRITRATREDELRALSNSLTAVSDFYRTLQAEMVRRLNLLPPGAAMAGVWTLVDNTRGVWKAPANVALSGVVEPAVPISRAGQQDLNAPPQGRSVNALRSFPGRGTLVWGARTLDGNNPQWRYINVRRTALMLEQSLVLALRALAGEPNDSATWATLKSGVDAFLAGVWRRGGLAGATPQQAFGVRVGLGETMSTRDIQQGLLRLSVWVALVRPSEFTPITIEQPMPGP